jgi:hypothetical protein
MEDCLTFLTISHNPALIEPDTHGFEAPRKTRGSASSEPAATLLVQQGYSAARGGATGARWRRSAATSASASASVVSKRQRKTGEAAAAPVELEAVGFERVHCRARQLEKDLVDLDRCQ